MKDANPEQHYELLPISTGLFGLATILISFVGMTQAASAKTPPIPPSGQQL
jgi:hypothetical protein